MNRRVWLLHCSGLALPWLGSGEAWAQDARATPKIVVLGDSLSAEYGITRGSGWVALLNERVQSKKLPHQVVNASISGDTTAGGRARLPAVLDRERPSHLIIELGGNDALRGMPLSQTRDHLRAMVTLAQSRKIKVLLVGMRMPPNYGTRYAQDFERLFVEVSQETRIPLVPFLLAGVADRPDADAWFQSDRIHPLARAHPVMLDNVWPALQRLL